MEIEGLFSPALGSEQQGGCEHSQARADPSATEASLEFPTAFVRPLIESAMSAVTARNRIPQIIWPPRIFRFGSLLGVKARISKVAVEPTGSDFVTNNRLDGWPARVNFAPRVMRSPVNRPRAYFKAEK